MTEPICFYIREEPYGFLSNFERAPQVVDGVLYPTNEHFYQAMKSADPAISAWIAKAPTAWHAMKAGRALKERDIRPHWNGGQDTEANSTPVKLEVMLQGLRAKFSQNADLREQLLATGDAVLHESPKGGFKDSFWGNTPKDDGSPGDSHLGRLLMQVRSELQPNICDHTGAPIIDGICQGCGEDTGGQTPEKEEKGHLVPFHHPWELSKADQVGLEPCSGCPKCSVPEATNATR